MSPVASLVSAWRCRPLPRFGETIPLRQKLFSAASEEITAKAANGRAYDPVLDARFLWAAQWLEVAEGTRHSIDPEIDMLCRFTMEPCPTSHKHLQANDA